MEPHFRDHAGLFLHDVALVDLAFEYLVLVPADVHEGGASVQLILCALLFDLVYHKFMVVLLPLLLALLQIAHCAYEIVTSFDTVDVKVGN